MIERAAVANRDVGLELTHICQALSLPVTSQQLDMLVAYMALLQRWNATYNLTAVRDVSEMLRQHLADCLAVVPALARQTSGGRVLDVGSGGGLPGVVLACMLPHLDVTCVDAVGKKAAFVRQVAGTLGLSRVHAVHSRVETLEGDPFDVVTSRAFASLTLFVESTRRLVRPSGIWMAMKGKRPDQELAEMPADVEVFHVEPLLVPTLEAQRCLVWMRRRVAL